MFNKQKKIDQNPELTTKVDGDLIVHNMPSGPKSASRFSRHADQAMSTGFKMVSGGKNNFKAIGSLIIIGSFLFIGALVYVSYLFIIKPAANQSAISSPAPAPAASSSPAAPATPTSSPAVTATSSETATVAPPAVVNLATSSAPATTSSDALIATSSGQTNLSNLPPLLDSDNDGLNDQEEAVLGTSATSSDTNHNGYPDLVEVQNNHNPIGSGPLSADSNLAVYSNKAFNYQILYPKSWSRQSVNNDATIIFTAPDNSLIQISAQSNTAKASILNWYQTLFPNITPGFAQMKSTASWDGIMGSDGLNFYLTDKQQANILVISYIPDVANRIVYPNIFQLMINSLLIR